MKEVRYIHWIFLTRKSFGGSLIYLSGNSTHPPPASSTDDDHNKWVAPTLTDLPVTATAPSMIAPQKKLWAASNTPAVAIYDSDDNMRLNFLLNLFSLMYLRIYLIKLVFDLRQGGRIHNSWIVLNQIIFHFKSNGFPFPIKLFFISNQESFRIMFWIVVGRIV